ncbi:MAG: FISUMP domain-containing protein, partial [Flavobacteriales bacterium]|nr:FISUMP domain-containing protein [Flavobacteriales bacterium]
HIPSDGEFSELTDFLGGESVAGTKMKEDVLWNGTNSSGWTGLPSGLRYSGGFSDDGNGGYWWSASESGSSSWGRGLSTNNDNVNRDGNDRYYGFSARCVRDD